jgi:hypothetical protein
MSSLNDTLSGTVALANEQLLSKAVFKKLYTRNNSRYPLHSSQYTSSKYYCLKANNPGSCVEGITVSGPRQTFFYSENPPGFPAGTIEQDNLSFQVEVSNEGQSPEELALGGPFAKSSYTSRYRRTMGTECRSLSHRTSLS